MSDQGFLKLLELRHSYEKYVECCQGYADNPFQMERWMLHYDILTALVDDERKNEEIDDATFLNQRFLMLEGKSKEVALQFQNFYLKEKGLPTLVNALADAIDKKTGDLIELKVTWVPDAGITEYLKKSIYEARDTGMVLVVADTNTCQIYQEDKVVFTKGLDMARGMLIRRKEVMEEYNMSDNSILRRVEIKPLPTFLQNLYNNLNLKDSEFFDVTKAKYKGKSWKDWENLKVRREKEVKIHKNKLFKGKSNIDQPSTSRKRHIDTWESRVEDAVKRAKLNPDATKKEKELAVLNDLQKEKNMLTLTLNKLQEAELGCENSLFPCANKKASIVVRKIRIKEGDLLEEMDKKVLLDKLKIIDEENSEYLKWKGLVLPLLYLENFTDLKVEEFSINCSFELPVHFSADGTNDWLGFNEMMIELKIRPKDILGLSTKNLSKVLSENSSGKLILDLFGVGWKDYKQVGPTEPEGIDFEFVPNEIKGNTGFPYWFERIRSNMASTFDEETFVMPTLCRREVSSNHPIDNWSEILVNRAMSDLVKTNAMVYCSVVENIHSRLGGLLAASEGLHVKEKSEGKRQYNNLRIQANMLETVCYTGDKNEAKRKTEAFGVVFRGPTHARSPTDTTNLFVLSFLKKESLDDSDNFNVLKRMNPNYTFGYGNIMGKEVGYGIRRFAYRRIEPSYFSFITNSLFEPFNSLGEEIFNELANDGYFNVDLEQFTDRNSLKVLKMRFSENVIIGVNMTNFDEGLMPFVRYEFLNSQARKAGENNYNLDYDSYIKKLVDEYKRAGVTKWLLHNVIF